MAVFIKTIDEILSSVGLPHESDGPSSIRMDIPTRTYRGSNGEPYLHLVLHLEEDGEYFKLIAPGAFVVDPSEGHHEGSFLKACMLIQWKTKLVQFEYDGSGSVSPVVEFPVEDGTVSANQVHRCIAGMLRLVETYCVSLVKARDEGIIAFPDPGAVATAEIRQLVQRVDEGAATVADRAILEHMWERFFNI